MKGGVDLNLLKNYLFISRERRKQGEKHRGVRETSIGCLSYTPN